MLKKNDEYVTVVENLGCNGEGICRIEGCAVFVPFALPEETVKIKILKVKNNYAFGKLLEVIKQSPDRVLSNCPVYYKCGGCSVRHMSYEAQLKWKAKTVDDCFASIAGIQIRSDSAICSDYYDRYRNKLQLPVRRTDKGNLIGFFRENSHDVVEIEDCLIQMSWARDLISAFKKYIKVSGETCFDEKTNKGNLKHIVCRHLDSKLAITAVITEKSLKNKDILIKILSDVFTDFSLYVNINKLNNNVVLGDMFFLLHGSEKLQATENGIKFSIGPASFMQVNDNVRRKIYGKVCDIFKKENNPIIIDAYSGAGFLSASLTQCAEKVYGVEIVQEAVDSANELVKVNGLEDKVTNVCGACEDVLPALVKKIDRNKNVCVLLDPPRKGIDLAVINAVRSVSPNKIVYVSCNPSTLARDVGLLLGTLTVENNKIIKTSKDNGEYSIDYLQTYDMFPATKRIETLVVLSHKNRMDILV